MPFRKKGRDGRKGDNVGGRPATKGVEPQGSNMSEEEKAEYNRKTTAKSRNQTTPPEARRSGEGGGSGGAGEGRGRGRPPLLPGGPMTKEELAESRKLWMKRARLGEKRRMAVSCRRDRQPPAPPTKVKRRSRSVGGWEGGGRPGGWGEGRSTRREW